MNIKITTRIVSCRFFHEHENMHPSIQVCRLRSVDGHVFTMIWSLVEILWTSSHFVVQQRNATCVLLCGCFQNHEHWHDSPRCVMKLFPYTITWKRSSFHTGLSLPCSHLTVVFEMIQSLAETRRSISLVGIQKSNAMCVCSCFHKHDRNTTWQKHNNQNTHPSMQILPWI